MADLNEQDWERIGRLIAHHVRTEIDKSVKPRMDHHSGKFGRVRQEIVEKTAEAKRETGEFKVYQEGINMGFERMLKEATQLAIQNSMAPVIQKQVDTEAAAVAGAEAAIAVKTTLAIEKTNTDIARKKTTNKQWVTIITTIGLAIFEIGKFILTHK